MKQRQISATLDIYNTCTNGSGQVWYGTYIDEKTGLSSNNPEAGVLVTIDKTAREQLEQDGVDILNTRLDCILTQDQFKVGKKKGNYYYRIVAATPHKSKSVELQMPATNATIETELQILTVVKVRIGRVIVEGTIYSYDDIADVCMKLEREAVKYRNAAQLLNEISILEDRLDKQYLKPYVQSKPSTRSTVKVPIRRSQN